MYDQLGHVKTPRFAINFQKEDLVCFMHCCNRCNCFSPISLTVKYHVTSQSQYHVRRFSFEILGNPDQESVIFADFACKSSFEIWNLLPHVKFCRSALKFEEMLEKFWKLQNYTKNNNTSKIITGMRERRRARETLNNGASISKSGDDTAEDEPRKVSTGHL